MAMEQCQGRRLGRAPYENYRTGMGNGRTAKPPHCTQLGSLKPVNDRHRALPLRVKLIDPAGWQGGFCRAESRGCDPPCLPEPPSRFGFWGGLRSLEWNPAHDLSFPLSLTFGLLNTIHYFLRVPFRSFNLLGMGRHINPPIQLLTLVPGKEA